MIKSVSHRKRFFYQCNYVNFAKTFVMGTIADIRKDYMLESFSEADAAIDAFVQFDKWWSQAIASEIVEVNAMTLATSSKEGHPSARIVLLKEYDANGFVFFTNYESHKASDMHANPRACLVFFWKELERQVRIEGIVKKVSASASDEYFQSRPRGSRIGAWASPQSREIVSREILESKVTELEKAFDGKEIARPAHWGGYCIQPLLIEFWQGRPSRLHDRIQYSRKDVTASEWKRIRLAP